MKLRKRLLAAFLAAAMNISLLAVPVSAQEIPIGEEAIEIITEDAILKGYTSNVTGINGETLFLGEFQINASEATDGAFTFTTDLPSTHINKDTLVAPFPDAPNEVYPISALWQHFEVCAYAAVLDTDSNGTPLPGAEVKYYLVHVDEENKKITGIIPVGTSGSAVMLFQQIETAGAIKFESTSKQILENSHADQSIDFRAEFEMSGVLTDNMVGLRDLISAFGDGFYFVATITLPEPFVLDTQKYTFNSSIFDLKNIEESSDSGKWLVNFDLRKDWDEDREGNELTDEDLYTKLRTLMTLDLSATVPANSITGNQNLVGSLYLHGDWDGKFDYNSESTAAIIRSIPAVTITPANMTVYMGGDGGYEGVVDGSGEPATTDSLPHPLFKITMPSNSMADPTDLTFTNTDDGTTWTVAEVGTGTGYYQLMDKNSKSVRVQFIDEEGTVHTDDTFKPTTVGDVYAEYDIKIFSGGDPITAAISGAPCAISTNSGTLIVRAVEDSDPTSDIATTAPTTKIAPQKAVAVVPEGGTTYTLNNTGVPIPAPASDKNPDGSKPSLLFDHIIEDANSTARTDALAEKADQKLGKVADNATRHYEIKYLDLVDANNGNAWITSSAGTDIYWGYPKDTDTNTTFKLVHFKGLHRDDVGGNSGFEITDISNLDLNNVEIIDVTNTGTGIKFHVDAGGFSPFALVWETTTSVDPDPGDGGGTRDDYTLHYVTNGGNHLSSETKSSAWTKDYEDLPTPVRDGYTFEGWYWDLRLTEPVTGDVKVDKTTVTLYAKWSGGSYGPDDTGVSKWLETDEHNAFLSGYPDGSFQADKNMTRAEVAQMFYALLLDKNVTITKTFSDVEDDAWYATAVNTMASLGMLEGYPDGTFHPDAPITRAEFAAIALAFAYDPASANCSYTDVNTSAWYYTYVAQATTYSWIGGYPDGSFRPNNSITRAEVAVIVNNMLGRSADKGYIDRNADELVSFVDLSKTHWAYYTIMEATNTHDYTTSSNGESWKA